MEGPVKYALVAVSAATEAFDAEYTYEMDPEITAAAKIGARVLVPFGRANKRVIGFITDILDTCGNNGTVKTVIRLVDEEVLVALRFIQIIDACSHQTGLSDTRKVQSFQQSHHFYVLHQAGCELSWKYPGSRHR